MLYLIWVVLIFTITAVIWWKSNQTAMTIDEQLYELNSVNQRANSFLMDRVEHKPYNGVEDK
jgi:ABC-type Mn2+/Zn2+ transport system permease subunit